MNTSDRLSTNEFYFPAVLFLINQKLHPHCDIKNPVNEQYDHTLSSTMMIPTKSFDNNYRIILERKFGKQIPFCVVLYRRQCLYLRSTCEILKENYLALDSQRQSIIDILSDGVYTDFDYGGRFFTKHRISFTSQQFNINRNSIFKGKIAVFDEAVDKMGYWSSLLHCFFALMYLKELTVEDVFGYVLFFCHQCNTTEIIVQASIDLLNDKQSLNVNEPIYYKLKNKCESYNKKKNDIDVGSGGSFCRFVTSNNRVYNLTEYQSSIDIVANAVALSLKLFHANKKRLNILSMFEYFGKVQEMIETMDGFGPVRSSHMIQFLSLVGMIPLQYYVCLPIHMSGGTGKFIEQLKWTKINMHDKCNNEVESLQKIYGCNFTPNMFENLCCILGRSRKRKDIFYHLPWVTKDSDGSKQVSTNTKIQFSFCIKVININNIFMTCKSSTHAKEEVVLTSLSTQNSKSIISYNFPSMYEQVPTHCLENKNHKLDLEWLENQSTIIAYLSEQMNQLHINHCNIPSFQDLYNNNKVIYGYDAWNLYSMIHSTPNEKFNFIVYSGSHKLENDEEINPKSRVEIAFPSNSEYFIIFHGRLVHSGARSIQLSDTETNKVLKSTRLFSYLRVPDHTTYHLKTRKTTRLTSYVDNQYQGTIDTASFSFPHQLNNIEKDNIIHLPEYNKESINSILQDVTLVPVAGNMITDGWEVYVGIDFTSDFVKEFSNQLDSLVCKHGQRFKGISGTKRKILELSCLDSLQNKSISKMNHLYRAFETILNDKLKKISYLEEVEMDNKAILMNIGAVNEQIPHRDYSSLKVNK